MLAKNTFFPSQNIQPSPKSVPDFILKHLCYEEQVIKY